jgi:hypothetical protein
VHYQRDKSQYCEIGGCNNRENWEADKKHQNCDTCVYHDYYYKSPPCDTCLAMREEMLLDVFPAYRKEE